MDGRRMLSMNMYMHGWEEDVKHGYVYAWMGGGC
jgi:hypothetical protein